MNINKLFAVILALIFISSFATAFIISEDNGEIINIIIDLAPTLAFSSNTNHTTTTAILTAVAVDSLDNKGIKWIKIYGDGNLIEEKNCNNLATCTFSKTIIETRQITHSYYAETQDLGGHTVTSNIIIIIFDGQNRNPIITSYNPTSPTNLNENSQQTFSVNAYDPDNDPLTYTWNYDNNAVSTNPNNYTLDFDYFSSGNHVLYVTIIDGRGGTAVRTWNVTVNNVLIPTTCSLIFNPLSPQFYGTPITSSCSCTSDIGLITETNAILERNSLDVTATENNIATILGAGIHNYRCSVIQTPNFAAAQTLSNYTINRANPNAHLALNNIENNLTIIYGTQSNATGWIETNQGAANAILYRNGTNIASGSPASNIITLGVGLYNYTYYYPQSQNYTEATVTRFLTINQATSACNLNINPASPIIYGAATTATCACTNPEASARLWRNGVNVDSENGIAVTLGAGTYNYVCNVTATQNYTGASVNQNYIVNPAPTILTLTSLPSWNVVYGTQTNVSCVANNPEVSINLYRNNSLVSNPNVDTLSAGTYGYVCNTTGSQNYTASSVNNNLLVSAQASSLILLLNNTNGNISVMTNDFVPVFANLTNPTTGNILVYNNGVEIYNGISPYSNVLIFPIPGIYNITAVYPANINYTGSFVTHFVNVNLTNNAPVVNLLAPANSTIYEVPQQISFNFLATDDNDAFFNCTLYLDGIANQTINTTNNVLSTINVDGISLGNHNWQVRCTDTQGLTGFSEIWNFIIRLHDIGISTTYTNSVNGIRISYANGTDILTNPANLYNGYNYSIRARINNYGTQLENINTTFYLKNATDQILIGYEEYSNLNVFHVVQFDLNNTNTYSGYYNITINTTIIGFSDYNLTDNVRQRNVFFGILDLEAPKYYGENANPVSPTTYGNGPYTFTINWTDNVLVQNVIFSFNNINYTPICAPNIPTQSTICIYSVNGLAAGTYNYQWYANDPSLNQNATNILTYVVNQATSACNLNINPASPIIYGAATTATCACTNPEASARLWRNGVNVDGENGIAVTLGAGTYNYVCNVTATQNYTGASVNQNYIVNQADPTTFMHVAINGTESDQNFIYPTITNTSAWNTITGQSGLIFNLYRNGNVVVNPNILQLSGGVHTYIYNTTGNQNYSAGTITRILTILPATTTLTLTAPNWTIYEGSIANVSCAANNGQVIINLYRNNVLVLNPDLTILPVGNYTYVCNTTGNANYTSASVSNILQVIPKLPGEVHLYLNGNENNITITYPTAINATATTPYGYVSLYRNGTLIGNGTSPQTNIANLAVGYYNYTAFSSGDSSHDNATITYFATINPGISSCILTINPNPVTYGTATTATCSCTNPEASAQLWRNGLNINSENGIAVTLGAGNYNYVCNVTATQNYTGASVSDILIITRANPNAHLALNNIENNLTIIYGTQSNATGWIETNQGAANAILYRNGTNIASGSPASNIITLSVGTYNYTYYYPQSQNYSEAIVTRFLTVTQQTTNLTLTILPANIIYDGMQSNISCNASNSEVIISLWRNGTLISSGNNYVQDVLILPVGNYTYVCNTSGSQNYSGNSVTDLLQVIPKEPGVIELYLNEIPANLNIEYLNNPVNATAISSFNNITIYRNGTLIGSGVDLVQNIANLAVGYYVYYANSSGNATHYPANITRYVTINQSIPTLAITMLPSDNVTYGQQTTTICNITNTNEINGLLELYRRLYNWTNMTTSVSNPDIQTLAGGAYNYICNVSASQNFTSAYSERTLTVNRANSSVILLLDGNNSNITRIEGNAINHTGIVTLYSLPNVVDVTINIFNPVGIQIASSTGVSPHTYIYTYNVPGIYRADAVFLGNENYTGSNATHYLNITPIIHDSNITNITYNKSNSTIYLNDVINVISYIRNDGNVNEPTINVTLQDNGNVVAWQIVNNLFANETVHETRQINFTWIARNDQIRTISVNALPVTGETDLSDNSRSFNAKVWKVCDVIDCNEFYPVTQKNTYSLIENFDAANLIVNRWSDQQFYDLKLEMDSSSGLNITSQKIIYTDLAPGEALVKTWAIDPISNGNQSLIAHAGNREYNSTIKYVWITP